jgi:hypothetical protein
MYHHIAAAVLLFVVGGFVEIAIGNLTGHTRINAR